MNKKHAFLVSVVALAGSLLWAAPKHVLVAYYSATGTTEAVAEKIAQATDGDLFEIQPRQAYSSRDLNWRDKNSRVNKEHDDPTLRDTALEVVTPKEFSSYDVIFIGYPIWWREASWVVDGFMSGNDFTGKTIIPFCTSLSSPFGESDKRLKELTKGGTWLEGARFNRSTTQSDVTKWVDSLPLD